MQRVTIRSMRYHTRYHTCYYKFSLIMQYVIITSMSYLTHYHIFPLSVAWFGAVCSVLPRVTLKFIKKYILILKKKKNDGNAW